jgi:hypothetical protein
MRGYSSARRGRQRFGGRLTAAGPAAPLAPAVDGRVAGRPSRMAPLAPRPASRPRAAAVGRRAGSSMRAYAWYPPGACTTFGCLVANGYRGDEAWSRDAARRRAPRQEAPNVDQLVRTSRGGASGRHGRSAPSTPIRTSPLVRDSDQSVRVLACESARASPRVRVRVVGATSTISGGGLRRRRRSARRGRRPP